MIAQIFHRTAELVIPIGIPANETNTYMERNPVTAEMKKENAESNSNSYMFLIFFAHQIVKCYFFYGIIFCFI